MTDDVSVVADRIGEVSVEWQAALAGRVASSARAMSLTSPALRLGVETIYEGHALHHDHSRTLEPGTALSLRLLVGDWCYAAGLCDVAGSGDLDAVATLAELIADTATLQPGAAHEQRWNAALADLGSRHSHDESQRT